MTPTSDPDVVEVLGKFKVRTYTGEVFRLSFDTFEEAVALANKHAENLQDEKQSYDGYINRRNKIKYEANISGVTVAHIHEWQASAYKSGWRQPQSTCAYCGSLHPEKLAEFIRQGATLELADQKYGWPHKWYVSVSLDSPLYGKLGSVKFYAVHLQDANADDLEVIERKMGIRYQFNVSTPGDVQWKPFDLENKNV